MSIAGAGAAIIPDTGAEKYVIRTVSTDSVYNAESFYKIGTARCAFASFRLVPGRNTFLFEHRLKILKVVVLCIASY